MSDIGLPKEDAFVYSAMAYALALMNRQVFNPLAPPSRDEWERCAKELCAAQDTLWARHATK